MRFLLFIVVIVATISVATPQQAPIAQSRKDVPLAPLPAKLQAAKKVFLINGGGNDLAYDALYATVKEWPRYQVVDTSADADIVIEFHVASYVYSTGFVLTIFDAPSKEVLWTAGNYPHRSRLKNREKEIIAAAQRLVSNWKERLGPN